MHSAIPTFLSNSCNRERPYFNLANARKEMNRMYQLFIKQYGMAILSDDSECFASSDYDGVTDNKLLTDQSVSALLVSHSISFSGCSFDTRFEIAMSSNGWPAGTFLDLLRCDNPLHLVTKTDVRARTALHWATEHFIF